LFGCFYFLYSIRSIHYPRKHRPFEALAPGTPAGQPTASACCSCIVAATVTITTPNIAGADTTAITAMSYYSFSTYKVGYCLRLSAHKLQNEAFSWKILNK
jgi:hypothetical protein